MLGYYNLSLQGTSHKANDTVCQDSSHIQILKNGWAVAVVADGLGSAKYSDVGAYLAVNTVVEHITAHCPDKWNIKKITSVLKEAYNKAWDSIVKKASEARGEIGDYDTTMTTAVYDGNQLVYAHVGDGGIITLSKKGDFSMLTNPQKGEEFNTVSPLRSKEKWVFGSSDVEICAFAMFTDGIYDVVCPWLLAKREQPVYVNYIRPFIDRNLLKANNMKDFEKIRKEVRAFLNSEYTANITDDKTIATVINLDILPAVKPDEYYKEPDWEWIQKEHKKKLYN
jgi:serine/threonine protein phosphatase PrpC